MVTVDLSDKELALLAYLIYPNSLTGTGYEEDDIKHFLENEGSGIADRWEKKGMTKRSGPDNTFKFDDGLLLMLHTYLEPYISFTGSAEPGETFHWAIYMKNQTIVLVERQKGGHLRISWLPFISLAFGSLYGTLKQYHRNHSDKVYTIDWMKKTDKTTDIISITHDQGSFTCMSSLSHVPGTDLTFNEAYDLIALQISKAYGNCLRKEDSNGSI